MIYQSFDVLIKPYVDYCASSSEYGSMCASIISKWSITWVLKAHVMAALWDTFKGASTKNSSCVSCSIIGCNSVNLIYKMAMSLKCGYVCVLCCTVHIELDCTSCLKETAICFIQRVGNIVED